MIFVNVVIGTAKYLVIKMIQNETIHLLTITFDYILQTQQFSQHIHKRKTQREVLL